MSGLLGLCATVSSTADRNTDVCEEQSELRVIVLGSAMAVERYSVLGIFLPLVFCLICFYFDIYIYVFSFLVLILESSSGYSLCNCSL